MKINGLYKKKLFFLDVWCLLQDVYVWYGVFIQCVLYVYVCMFVYKEWGYRYEKLFGF